VHTTRYCSLAIREKNPVIQSTFNIMLSVLIALWNIVALATDNVKFSLTISTDNQILSVNGDAAINLRLASLPRFYSVVRHPGDNLATCAFS
jgi:hypothetical protein